ncbi:MAG: hypothetical protein EZS28_053104, partial [Streblomastix strix]
RCIGVAEGEQALGECK